MPQVDFEGGGGRRRRAEDTLDLGGGYSSYSGQPTAAPAQPANPSRPGPDPSTLPPNWLTSGYATTPTPGGAPGQVNYTGPLHPAIDPKTGLATPINAQGGADWENWFKALVQGQPSSPATLAALAPIFQHYGLTLNPNGRGDMTDFTLPGGRYVVDPLIAGGAGGWGWTVNDLQAPQASAAGGYGNAHSSLFENEILSRLEALRQPVNDPLQPLFQLLALARVGDLTQASPYTAGEDATLRAHYLDPLTGARDAAMQRNKERIGARGMAGTSGLLDALNAQTERGYESAVGQAANATGLQAIDEKQRRATQALQVMSDLLNQGRTSRSEDTARAQELLQTAGLLPELDLQTLSALNTTAGTGGSPLDMINALLGLGRQNLTSQEISDRNRQMTTAAWGQYLGYILNNLDKFSGLFG